MLLPLVRIDWLHVVIRNIRLVVVLVVVTLGIANQRQRTRAVVAVLSTRKEVLLLLAIIEGDLR